MNADDRVPALRRVEIMPFQDENGQQLFALQDMTQIAPQTLAVSVHGFFLLSQLDGESTVRDVQLAFLEEFGQAISLEQISETIASLDEALLLETDRFEQAYKRRRDEYLAADARDNRERYPDEATLRAELDQILNAESTAAVSDLRGLIAPHLDYARGAPCYREAYAALAQAPPADRYVILGANHFGSSSCVVATAKDFLTPLGRVPTDSEFIRELESALGQTLREHELDHANEHSVELQVQMLQAALGGRPFSIVPALCPDPCGESGTRPHDGCGPDLGDFADALRDVLARDGRRTVLIAGADLSHVGQRFGEETPTTPEFLKRVEASDTALLGLLERREDEAFIKLIADDENTTRICSAGCVYTLLRALPGEPCRVLRYHQAVNMEMETHVTCFAATIGR